jgi:hypothetical protein
MHDLPLVIGEMPIGGVAAVTVWRRNAALSLRPTIGEIPANPAVARPSQQKLGDRRPEQAVDTPLPTSAAPPAI